MKFALLTSAINGDNSGDSIIESAVRRLLLANEIVQFPLTTPLTNVDFESINTCDALIICGTNLYQHVFACNLTPYVIDQIKIPIIPFGIGSSAAIGAIPKMDQDGIVAVQAIHRKCVVSSVRDEASLRFLHSIGVKNVILSGCPVLFHGLSCPDFTPSGTGYTLTPRARLLHIDNEWNARQLETLGVVCKRYNPSLVLQSPYDIPIAEMLAEKYGVEIVMDENWQAEQYIRKAREQEINIGFRLHFAMLSISYGKPSFLISHDSRASEFCKLLRLPLIDIKNYSDNALMLQVEMREFDSDGVRRRWDELSWKMNEFMKANGLGSNLIVNRTVHTEKDRSLQPIYKKPRILMLVDKKNWAFDNSARQIACILKHEFEFDFKYVRDSPKLNPFDYDLVYVFFWGETYFQQFGFESKRIIKEVSSHRWEDDPKYGPCTVTEFASKYLNDCGAVICTSLRLLNAITEYHPKLYHTPNGVSHSKFKMTRIRTGPLIIGWAGNLHDGVKGVNDFLDPVCHGRYSVMIADGSYSHARMNSFYNKLDVIVICSRHEGEPLTLLEAMAAGCFPVCTDVGIVPELIEHGVNGYIVTERSSAAFTIAFEWCAANLDKIRKAGEKNAQLIRRERNWEVCAQYFKRVFDEVYDKVSLPRFRNDDVSWDTSLNNFVRFCEVFHKHGFIQIHGITLRGKTNTLYKYAGTPVEYEGYDTIAKLDNDCTRKLSTHFLFEERVDLISYLNSIPDEIALHGLYHTDYSQMTFDEQKDELKRGLEVLRMLFPLKKITYFIPPFNKVNAHTSIICSELKLKVLTTEGVHLESELGHLVLKRDTLYRYHHHRFYPESAFSYYDLSIEKLDEALQTAKSGWQKYTGLKRPNTNSILTKLSKLVDRVRN